MGVRADFYIGTGPTAVWLGSIAWEGDRIDEVPKTEKKGGDSADTLLCRKIKNARSEHEFRLAVFLLLSLNDDATIPEMGWPWAWDDSRMTDYAYAFVKRRCRTFQYGQGADWPDMSARRNLAHGRRSGFITL